ncbi:hypothetical protein A2V54_01815 [candidate division WWE3 bacterium RBG_19FT_COMBO_53_11]|uniref:Uncharacterized protein n=1 Tax=candidate division WWE3 bacterium RBG_19FT_COMBO_53_11 TaxID=1802613 RepID=A0A1F4UID7_UNCKA|nr:MAG: hypothetical protein A2155_02450 [candidate division WWE3 bacterium RBG_16_52_45]OGC44724.1 MAG: hypothetical protein A2V54_01815 [candidate division WWE3 bacterium RBG_19FT_COMBO_53_11]
MDIFDRVEELKKQGKTEEEAFEIASKEAREEQEGHWPTTEEGRKEWGFKGQTPEEQVRIDEEKQQQGSNSEKPANP